MTFSFGSFCRVNDCDDDNPCDECTAVDDATRSAYLKHCSRLQSKLKYKTKTKASSSATVPDVADPVPSPDCPVSPALPHNPAVLLVEDSSSLEQVKGEILSQVKGLFDSFAKSLEFRFISIEGSITEVASSRDLPSVLAAHVAEPSVRDTSAQDVINVLFFCSSLGSSWTC